MGKSKMKSIHGQLLYKPSSNVIVGREPRHVDVVPAALDAQPFSSAGDQSNVVGRKDRNLLRRQEIGAIADIPVPRKQQALHMELVAN